jgi:AcrR family transcriptional regulator
MAHHGLAEVKIDRICSQLGVTRGSFYWHFESRDALIAAALDHWHHHSTTEVLEKLRTSPEADVRLRRLFRAAYRDVESGLVFAALASSSSDPRVHATLERINAARLDFLQECYELLGCAPAKAEHHALLAYSAYIGLYDIYRARPAHVGEDAEARTRAYIDYLVERLLDDVVDRKSAQVS